MDPAARAVRRVPALLAAVADGHLHLTAVVLLAPHIDEANADELIAFAAKHSCADIRSWISARAQRAVETPDLLTQVAANHQSEPNSNPVMSSPRDVEVVAARVAATPPSRPSRVLTFTVPAELADAYREALALAPYEVAHDPARAFAHMLAAWRSQLEKRRCGKGAHRTARCARTDTRHVPAAVRDEVWRRDGGQCTYTSDAGRRCQCRAQLELDHVTPIARGGASTADNLRLRCRRHNQLEAERTFGRGFMVTKRDAARTARDAARAARDAAQAAARTARDAARDAARAERDASRDQGRLHDATRRAAAAEVVPYLRRLRLGANEARDLAWRVSASEKPLEDRVRAALKLLAPRGVRTSPPAAAGTP